MRIGAQTLFPIAIMALLAGLTFWLARVTQTDTTPANWRERHDPDYTIEDFTLKRFDAQGKLQHTLQARRMTHYPDNDATELEQPRITALGGPALVFLKANRGTVGPDGQVVVLRDAVEARRDAAPGLPAARFTTTEATLYPDDEYLTTQASVTLTQGASTVTGTGFELNNKTQAAVLHAGVRATYLKEKP